MEYCSLLFIIIHIKVNTALIDDFFKRVSCST